MPEIVHHCQRTPFLLVGTQVDLRDQPATIEKLAKNRQKPISFEAGEKLARELKAVKYVECSALTQVGDVDDIAGMSMISITIIIITVTIIIITIVVTITIIIITIIITITIIIFTIYYLYYIIHVW